MAPSGRISENNQNKRLSWRQRPTTSAEFTVHREPDPGFQPFTDANQEGLQTKVGTLDVDPRCLPRQHSPTREDGFITVTRSNSIRASKVNDLRAPSRMNSNKRLNPLRATDVNPVAQRLVAAAGRSEIYKPKSGSSYYKQSALPADQRDPVLLAIETNRGGVFPKDKFKPGMIIRAAMHEQDFHGTAGASLVTLADKYRSDTKFGPIYTKYRKLVVIALYESHYIAV